MGVPEADIAGVRTLDEAEVVFTAFPERVFTGTPTTFARKRSDRTMTYDVEIEVDNADGLILSGQTARVRLALHRYDDEIAVPSGAVFTRNKTAYVMVVDGEIAREIPVETGASSETQTVVESGLNAGDKLVIEGFNRLADGSPVEIVD